MLLLCYEMIITYIPSYEISHIRIRIAPRIFHSRAISFVCTSHIAMRWPVLNHDVSTDELESFHLIPVASISVQFNFGNHHTWSGQRHERRLIRETHPKTPDEISVLAERVTVVRLSLEQWLAKGIYLDDMMSLPWLAHLLIKRWFWDAIFRLESLDTENVETAHKMYT